MTNYADNRPEGFTLVELMIAMSLSMIILLAAMAIMIASHRSYQMQTDQTYVQQVSRAVADFISADLYKVGLGSVAPEDALTEEDMIFTTESRNNNNAPDFLAISASDGGVVYNQAVYTLIKDQVSTISVIPGSLKIFSPNDRLNIFTMDRVMVATAIVNANGVDDVNGTLSITVNGIMNSQSATSVSLEVNSLIMQAPNRVYYGVGGNGILYRCWSPINTLASCPCAGNCSQIEVAEGVEDFQVSVMLENLALKQTVWRNDFDWASSSIEDRKGIKALKIEILIKAPGIHQDFTDSFVYHLGDRTFSPSLDAVHQLRHHMSMTIHLKNMRY